MQEQDMHCSKTLELTRGPRDIPREMEANERGTTASPLQLPPRATSGNFAGIVSGVDIYLIE